MYVRVKREKTTLFVEIEPQETGLELKSKLQKLLDGKLPDEMKLVLVSNQVELEDAKRLADLKVQNDDIIALCYRKQSAEDGDQGWEDVNITAFPADKAA